MRVWYTPQGPDKSIVFSVLNLYQLILYLLCYVHSDCKRSLMLFIHWYTIEGFRIEVKHCLVTIRCLMSWSLYPVQVVKSQSTGPHPRSQHFLLWRLTVTENLIASEKLHLVTRYKPIDTFVNDVINEWCHMAKPRVYPHLIMLIVRASIFQPRKSISCHVIFYPQPSVLYP